MIASFFLHLKGDLLVMLLAILLNDFYNFVISLKCNYKNKQ